MSTAMLARVGGPDKLRPMETTSQAGKRHRRPQAERSAETRAKLVDAAIACLHRLGYGATTVTIVAEQAGVSRGAMTHQFPAKTDLMLEVVQAVFEKDAAYYRESLLRFTPIEWMRALPDMMWEVVSQPSAIALMEVMLASRSDPELAERLRIIQHDIDVQAHAWVVERIRAAGIEDRPDGEAVHRVFVATFRGLALEALFMKNRAEVEKSISVVAETLRHLFPAIAEKC